LVESEGWGVRRFAAGRSFRPNGRRLLTRSRSNTAAAAKIRGRDESFHQIIWQANRIILDKSVFSLHSHSRACVLVKLAGNLALTFWEIAVVS